MQGEENAFPQVPPAGGDILRVVLACGRAAQAAVEQWQRLEKFVRPFSTANPFAKVNDLSFGSAWFY